MAYEIAIDLHPQPLQMQPPYFLYAVVTVLVLIVDLAALKLYQLTGLSTAERDSADRADQV